MWLSIHGFVNCGEAQERKKLDAGKRKEVETNEEGNQRVWVCLCRRFSRKEYAFLINGYGMFG